MKVLAFLTLLMVILACGGGGGTVSGGGGGGGPEMSFTERSATIEKVRAKSQTYYNSGLTIAQANDSLAAYMRTLPQFAHVETTVDECVWGRFTDGRTLVVARNRLPDKFDRAPIAPHFQRSIAPKGAFVSKGTKARLFHTFGANFGQQQNPINDMGNWLINAGYSIQPVGEGDGRVTTLKSINGVAFLYMNSHGGSFEFPDGTKTFCVTTSTLFNEGNEKLPDIAADRAAGNLVYFTAPNGETGIDANGKQYPIEDTRYAITSKFVRSYWSFDTNAVVFMNACWSGYTAEAGGAQDFIAAIHAKGAATYLGWTNKAKSPNSEIVPQFLVDRLCSANAYQKESPDQRAFFVKEVIADMKKRSILPGPLADLLIFNRAGVTNSGLRPALHFMMMSEPTGKLELYGQFGDDPGEVYVDGVPATVSAGDWTSDSISVRIPDKGAGSCGDVEVRVHGKKSNTRRLTKWASNLSYKQNGSGTLQITITAKIVIRADFDMRRNAMGGVLTLVDPIPVFASRESTCSFLAKGQHVGSNNQIIEKWTGSGTVPLIQTPNQNPGAYWYCNGAFDPTNDDFGIGLVCGGPVQITGTIGNATVNAGGAAYVKKMNRNTWIAPAESSPGSTSFTFTAFTPTFAPNTVEY